MMIKVFTLNKNNKIELTEKELKQLLDSAYWEGYNNKSTYVWSSPTWSPYTITASGKTSNNITLTSDNISFANNINATTGE